jgi:hypothetical protein
MINPILKKGDRVILLHMGDETSVMPGTSGVVTHVSTVYGDKQYSVDWDNGSKLVLISGVDMWDKEGEFKKRKTRLKENEVDRFKRQIENIKIFKHFKMSFFMKYLKLIRDSNITNMVLAAPYLYMGRERIEYEFKYKRIPKEDVFEKVLDLADESQSEMINSVIKLLESEGKEPDLSNINRYLKTCSQMIIENYILSF